MQDDVAALKAWSAMFKEPAHLLEVVVTHWELQKKRGIKANIAETEANFAAGEYFKAGEATADAFTLLFGKSNERLKWDVKKWRRNKNVSSN